MLTFPAALVGFAELEELEAMVRKIAAAGVDAVIVQDLGAVSATKMCTICLCAAAFLSVRACARVNVRA